MKKHYIVLGLFCLLAIVACSDNDPVVEVNNDNPTEELPPLPTEVITGSRAMWVSYDPISASDSNNSSGISSALISWRLLKTDPSNIAFDIYKSVDGEAEVKLNEEPISNTTSWWMQILMYQKRMYIGSLLPIRLKRFAIIRLPLKWQKSFIMRLD